MGIASRGWVGLALLGWVACGGSGDPVVTPPDAPELAGEEVDPSFEASTDEEASPEATDTAADAEATPPDPCTDHGPYPATVFVTNQGYVNAALGVINCAQNTLQVDQLEFPTGNLPEMLMNALKAAVKRGVHVTVLLDEIAADNAGRVTTLTAAGADARLSTTSRTLHVKLVVADRTRVLVGSTNFSQGSMKNNNEVNWLLSTAALGETFAKYSDALWTKDSTACTIAKTAIAGVTPLGDGQYHDVVYPLIKNATRRVRLIMYQLNPDNDAASPSTRLMQAVIDAKTRGLDVRVVLENQPLGTTNLDAIAAFKAGAVELRLDPDSVTTHAKLLLADDNVVIYSGNWTYSGLEKNHEAGAVIPDTALAAQASSYFDKVWLTGTAAP